MKALVFLLLLGLALCASGQSGSTAAGTQAAEVKAQRILNGHQCKESKRAAAYDAFLQALKNGQKGEGVHYPWMDRMRQLGIKQALFEVSFEWKNGEYRFKARPLAYLRQYYCHEDEVRDGKLLRQIRASGLERELKDAIIARARRYVREHVSGWTYDYLLDDEDLPVFGFVT